MVEIDNSTLGWCIWAGSVENISIGKRVTLDNVTVGKEFISGDKGAVYGGKVYGHRFLGEFQVSSVYRFGYE